MPRSAESVAPVFRRLQRPAAERNVLERVLKNADASLRRLIAQATGTPEFWSFAAARNGYSHCYFRYPAMMVAEMQRHLLSIILTLQPNIRALADPFSGSGTILVEAMFRGLDVHAYDVNPLAILLCKSKTVLCEPSLLLEASRTVIGNATEDRRDRVETQFRGIGKWFSKPALRQLSALRRAIREIPRLDVRRFLWVALAETVRQTSKSRTSTYKLHIRPPDEREGLPKPLDRFAAIIKRNIDLQRRTRRKLQRAGLLAGRRYKRKTRIAPHDARNCFSSRFDLVVTSPPYGDNQSTVPYGQNAFLPLQWIDFQDIDGRLSKTSLRTTYEIDNRSLGGATPSRANKAHARTDPNVVAKSQRVDSERSKESA